MARFADGTSIAVGSLELTISAVTYATEDFTINKTGERIELKDEDGEPTKACVYVDTPTFSCTVQFAASTTDDLDIGDEFIVATGPATGTWIIDNVGTTFGQRAFKKASISGSQKINV